MTLDRLSVFTVDKICEECVQGTERDSLASFDTPCSIMGTPPELVWVNRNTPASKSSHKQTKQADKVLIEGLIIINYDDSELKLLNR